MADNAGLLQALQSILGTAGTVLDTPGSVFRGLLSAGARGVNGDFGGAGQQAGRALGGIFDPEQRVSGAEMLGNDPNASLFSGEGLANMGTEMALDPINLLGGLGLLKIGRGARLAKANNAKLAGGMPKDIAKLTKAVDEAGNPITAYHGSQTPFDTPDPKLGYSTGQDYGPGFYTATKGDDASGFILDDELGANVGRHYLDIRKPFYADQAMQPMEAEALFKRMLGGDAPEALSFAKNPTPGVSFAKPDNFEGLTGQDVIRRLEDAVGAEGTVAGMKRAGYDGVFGAYGFGDNPGFDFMSPARHSAKDFKQLVSFDANQIYAPWTKPSQQVPSMSPLLAALGLHNVGRMGADRGQ